MTNNYIILPLVNANQIGGTTINIGSPGAAQDGYALTYVNASSDLELKPVSGGSSVTFAGDLSGTSSSQTVIAIDGYSLPNPGNHIGILHSSGSALTWSAVNLAGSDITGTLAVGNQASQALGGDLSGTTASGTVIKLQGNAIASGTNGATQDGYTLQWVNGSSQYQVVKYAGDVTGSPNANTVISLTGSSGKINVASTGNVITWAAATTAPGLAQLAQTSDVATTDLIIGAQGPYATAATNKTPGNVRLRVLVPVGAANEAGTLFDRNGTVYGAIQPRTGFPTIAGRIWLGPNAAAQTTTNYCVEAQASDSYWNASTTHHLQIAIGDVVIITSTVTTIGANGTGHSASFFGTASLGGGSGVISIKNAGTNPSTNPAGGVILYSELTTGNLKNRGSLGAIVNMAPAGSLGVNSQSQIVDGYIGCVRTASSATPTALMVYPTLSGTGGQIILNVSSRAITTGTGITIGDTATNQYVLNYKNVSGTVSVGGTGQPVVTGTAYALTTASALVAPTLTVTVATNVITVLVKNVALATIDSQVVANISVI